jgi:hypothetical protein
MKKNIKVVRESLYFVFVLFYISNKDKDNVALRNKSQYI